MKYTESDGALEGTLVPSRRNYLRTHLSEVPPFRALIRTIECHLFEDCGPLRQPVLDLGCGDGHFVASAFSGPVFAGLDPELSAAHEAHLRKVYFLTVCASATRLPFQSASFPTVISNCVLEHIPDVEAVVEESSRVLSPGGRFLFGVPSHRFGELLLGSRIAQKIGLKRLGRRYGDWFNRHSKHFHTEHPEIWLRRLRTHGFRVKRWAYYMTPQAHLLFDFLHYLSLPHLLSRKVTGRWVIPGFSFVGPLERWLRPHVDSSPCPSGAYLFFDAVKDSGRPESE